MTKMFVSAIVWGLALYFFHGIGYDKGVDDGMASIRFIMTEECKDLKSINIRDFGE